jgi:hypothetical protein
MADRKRRTREHIIADLNVNHVQRLALESGYVVEERTKSDYGYDLLLTTFDAEGYVEHGAVHLQLKATDNLARYELSPEALSISIDVRDWNLWKSDPEPVFLILYDAPRRRAYWLYLQAYFNSQPPPKPGAKTLTIHLPRRNVLRRSTMSLMRDKKAAVFKQTVEVRHA